MVIVSSARFGMICKGYRRHDQITPSCQGRSSQCPPDAARPRGRAAVAGDFSLANFDSVLRNAAIGRAFSLLLALLTATICAILSIPVAYMAVVRRNLIARLLDALADAPYAVPGTVVALAMIVVFLPPIPLLDVSIYGTFWILLAAYLSRFLLLALRPVGASLASIDPALDEAGRIVGGEHGSG